MSKSAIEALSGLPIEYSGFSDPNTIGQWYFDRAGNDISIRAEDVWPEYTGKGVLVGVMDSIINTGHQDIAGNYDADHDYDLSEGSEIVDWETSTAQSSHGTAVAGVIAAVKDNGFGSAGIAYDASITNFAMDFGSSSILSQVSQGILMAKNVDVLNASWSFTQGFRDKITMGSDAYNELQNGVEEGRDGLGTVMVFAAGNSGLDVSSNYHGYQNSPFTIAVASVDVEGEASGFSSIGSNILLSAAGTDIISTNAYGSIKHFSGTSFAAPMVSAAAAIILEANEELGYRDVMEILALSARADQMGTDDRGALGWVTNSAENFNGAGMHYSDSYGYGFLNVRDAVRLAETWTKQQTFDNLEIETVKETYSGEVLTAGETDHLQVELQFDQDISIETAQISIGLAWFHSNDLDVYITSPEGTVSQLVYDNDTTNGGRGFYNFPFSTNALLGESAKGTWTLDIYNRNPEALLQNGSGPMTGTLKSLELTVYGSEVDNDDTYFYNDEYANGYYSDADLAARSVLADTDGGTDTVNAAMVTGSVKIDLTGATQSDIMGKGLTIKGDAIENVFTGDGNDTVIGSGKDNALSTGRGNDVILASGGEDTIDGGAGEDTLKFSVSSDVISSVFRATADLIGIGWYDGVKQAVSYVTNIETFAFIDATLGLSKIVEMIGSSPETPEPSDPDAGKEDPSTPTEPSPPVEEDPVQEKPVEEDPVKDPEPQPTPPEDIEEPSEPEAPTTPEEPQQPEEPEKIDGNAGNNQLAAGDTDAVLNGRAGHDDIWGGAGQDTIFGGAGNDTVHGGAGDDRIIGALGNDSMFGEMGNDTIFGNQGSNLIDGGEGDDRLFGGQGSDLIYGGDGNDTLSGVNGSNSLYGGDGNDRLVAGRGTDEVYGGDGNDTLVSSGGESYLDGGLGDNRFVCRDGEDTIVLHYQEGAENRVVGFDHMMDTVIVKGDGISASDLVFKEENGGTSLGISIDGMVDYFAFFTQTDVEALNQQLDLF